MIDFIVSAVSYTTVFFAGVGLGTFFGAILMSSLSVASKADDEAANTMLDHGGYEAAQPYVVHDFTKGGRIV